MVWAVIILTVFCIALIILFCRSVYLFQREKRILEEKHRLEQEDIISQMHHERMVPIMTRAIGLNNLLSLGRNKHIQSLLKLYEKQDWNTSPVILDLSDEDKVEGKWQAETLKMLMDAFRDILKDENFKQEKK